MLVFNIFGILSVVYSCQALYSLSEEFSGLEDEIQSICRPYTIWKTMFFIHVILFFVGLSFAVGTCDTILNEEDTEIQVANMEPERQGFTKTVEQSLSVLRSHCVFFCGPFVLVESILSCFYYTDIIDNCQPYIKDPMTSTMVYILIAMGCISVCVSLYCGYTTYLFLKAAKNALPSMRNSELWQVERQRQRSNRTRVSNQREQDDELA